MITFLLDNAENSPIIFVSRRPLQVLSLYTSEGCQILAVSLSGWTFTRTDFAPKTECVALTVILPDVFGRVFIQTSAPTSRQTHALVSSSSVGYTPLVDTPTAFVRLLPSVLLLSFLALELKVVYLISRCKKVGGQMPSFH